MKIGVYDDYARIMLTREEVEKFRPDEKTEVFFTIHGSWNAGYMVKAYTTSAPDRRKLLSYPKKSNRGTHPFFIDFNRKVLESFPFSRLSQTEVHTKDTPDGIFLNTNGIKPFGAVQPPFDQGKKNIAAVALREQRETEAAISKGQENGKAAITHLAPTVQPEIPAGYIDVMSMSKIPKSANGLRHAIDQLNIEIEKYNRDSLVPLELAVIDGRILFKAKAA